MLEHIRNQKITDEFAVYNMNDEDVLPEVAGTSRKSAISSIAEITMDV